MAKAYPGRYAADIDGDFVVFLIGMRVTKPWRPTKWVPVPFYENPPTPPLGFALLWSYALPD